jgi:hypothetical protein
MVQNPFNGIEREALDLLELIEKIKRRRRIHSMELKEILACSIANTHSLLASLNLPSTSSNPGVCRGLP